MKPSPVRLEFIRIFQIDASSCVWCFFELVHKYGSGEVLTPNHSLERIVAGFGVFLVVFRFHGWDLLRADALKSALDGIAFRLFDDECILSIRLFSEHEGPAVFGGSADLFVLRCRSEGGEFGFRHDLAESFDEQSLCFHIEPSNQCAAANPAWLLGLFENVQVGPASRVPGR